AQGMWQDEDACTGLAPECVDGQCRCVPGATRCGDAGQPQVCSAERVWTNVGRACANCVDGRCPAEDCTAERRDNCASVGCECASDQCSGAFCNGMGDGCTNARRT